MRLAVGLRPSGVDRAGNGAAMRAAIVGVVLDAPERVRVGRSLAEVTHRDPRAVEAALYVAEVAAHAAEPSRRAACERALSVVADPRLRAALDDAVARAVAGEPADAAARAIGTTGYAVHTAAWATYAFVRWGDEPARALEEVVAAGGDTDSIAAIVGAWCGARGGVSALPARLVADLEDGPFGRAHLRALASALADGAPPPPIRALEALVRNLALFPVVLGHGIRRLVPF